MAGFNLTAQLQLQAPTNTSQVVGNIKKQLSGITANIQVKANAQTLAKLNKQMQGVSKSSESASKSVSNLNRNLSEAARRFSVITVATGTMLSLARAIKNATGEAIAFERELVKISQVTGKTVGELGSLANEVTRLSTSLGASSKDLLNVSRVLSQAGFSATKTKQALDILAKTSLGATFDSIQDTTEGAIAVLRQFRKEARAAGGDIKFLEQTMDAINSVSKSFAVESGDLITVIRRVGGVFESAGGSVNELIALFTSVRATTRESAETISTGLRTIFTRIQRTDTVQQLEQLGIQLRDSQGQFVGAFEAVRRLSQGLSSLDPRDFRFSEIVESLGGFRQIGKVIPLIQQFTTAQNALNVAQSASGSVTEDAITAQKSLAVQAQKVREEFSALIRKLTDSSTFRSIASGALEFARALIRVADAIEPLLPLITSLAAVKIGQALSPGLGALVGGGGRRKAYGGRIHKFARGGFVPGTGNRDTVPAMLQPGEFVIKKSSANKLGAGTLEAMNNNRFNEGSFGGVKKELDATRKTKAIDFKKGLKIKGEGGTGSLTAALGEARQLADIDTYAAAFLRPEARGKNFSGTVTGLSAVINKALNDSGVPIKNSAIKTDAEKIAKEYASRNKFELRAGSLTGAESGQLETTLIKGIVNSAIDGAKLINDSTGIQGDANIAQSLKSANFDQVVGNLFELVLSNAGAPFGKPDTDPANAPFDFPKGLGAAADKFGLPNTLNGKPVKTEAKSFFSEDNISTLTKKVQNELKNESVAELRQVFAKYLSDRGNESSLDDLKKAFGGGSAADIIARADKSGIDVAKSGRGKYTVRQRRASGGSIYGQDSVPSLLTPGEFVINKSAAQSIGYGNLNKMNQTGVQRFARGGAVQRFANGGAVSTGNFGLTSAKDIALVNAAAKKNVAAFNKLTADISSFQPSEARAALVHFARNFDAAGDEAAQLDSAVEAAHKSATQFGTGATRTGKKDRNPLSATTPEGPPRPATKVTGDMFVEVEKDIASFGGSIKENERTMLKFKEGMSKGMTKQEALNRALQDSAKRQSEGIKVTDTLTKTRKTLADKLKQAATSAGGGVGRAAGAVAGAAGSVGRQAKALEGGANAAQNIAFMGAAALTTAVQMSSLSDSTKKATTETVALASGLLAAGSTVIQMLSGLATIGKAATTSELKEVGANELSTQSELQESAANQTAAVSNFTKSLVGGAAVAGTLFVAFKYFASQARAQADELKKSTDKIFSDLESGKGGEAQAVKSNVAKEIALRDEGSAFDSAAVGAASTAGAVGVGAAVVSATAFGAALGSTVPIVGTLVGALAGAAVGLYLYNTASEEAAEAAKQQAESINATIDSYVNTTKSLQTFNQALADIDIEKNLAPEERVKRRTEAVANLDTGASELPREFAALQKVAKEAGKSISALTDADFEDNASALAQFQLSTKATAKTMEALAAKTNAARQTLSEAANLAFTGEFSFDEVMAANDQYKTALNQTTQAIRDEADAQIQARQAEAASIRAAADARRREGGTLEEWQAARASAAAIEQEATVIAQRAARQQKDVIDGQRAVADAAKKQRDAEIAAAQAAEALRQEFNAMKAAMAGLRAIEQAQAVDTRNIANAQAVNDNQDLDFSQVNAIQGFDDITAIDNIRKFDADVNQLINELPAGMRKNFRKMLGDVEDANAIFTTGKDQVLKQFGKIKGEVNVDKILAAAGADLSRFAPEVQGEIKKAINEAASSGGGINIEEFDEIFAPFKDLGQEAANNLQKIEGLRNTEIKNYSSYLDGVQSQRDKELDGQKKILKAEQNAARLMAKARGKELTSNQLEAQRTSAAQLSLSGTGVRAGDARGAAQAKQLAQQRRRVIQQQIATDKLSITQKKKLMDEDKRLQDVVKKTGDEIERLGDQSERAAEILEQIDEERAKRETITNLLGDFVKGGDQERKGIVDALLGVRAAVATGTVQNQTPEQRSATFDMLDRLENIQIAGTGGLTGKEVKQEIIFRDAIRMGLDPQIAQTLATATSKEEQLIQSLDRLNQTTIEANRLRANPNQQGFFNQPAQFPWTGGYITGRGKVAYRAKGGSIFQPKGTDTVPAMLTPGEFVIKKSAVDNIGVGNLQALNKSNGGLVQYRQNGGPISAGQDLVSRGGINIPTGDQYKKMFVESAQQIGPGQFLKVVRDIYGDDIEGEKKNFGGDPRKLIEEQKNVVGALSKLIRLKSLDLNRLSFPDETARYLDNVLGNSDIIERLEGGVVSFKRPQGIFLREPTVEAAKRAKSIAEGYRSRLAAFANAPTSIINTGSGSRKNRVASRVIQRAMGFSPLDNIYKFSQVANERIKGGANVKFGLDKYIAALERGIAGKGNLANVIDNLNADENKGSGIGVGGSNVLGIQAGGGATGKAQNAIQQQLEVLQNAGLLSFATGGSVPGASDTVPAMLTPGEFVMSKESVKKHGIGYMKSLNRGRIPGFNRGGLVGSGAVQYKQAGGDVGGGGVVLGLDPTRVQGVLDAFNTSFSASLDAVIGPFSGISQNLGRVADAFGSMTMTHQFSGELSLSVNISNKDAIIEAVKTGITPELSSLIERQVNESINAIQGKAIG